MQHRKSIDLIRTGFSVRSDLRAGRTVCYQEINGYWYPVVDPNNPVPPPPAPTPTPGVQYLNCQSCTGTQTGTGQLSNANCQVCYL
jgi:hypothetical protein